MTDEHTAPPEGFITLPPDLPHLDPSDILKTLDKAKSLERDDPARPSKVSPAELLHLEALFQARGDGEIDDKHVEKLLYTLSEGEDLTPISVWRCGTSIILLDGHHRTKAYKLLGRRTGKSVTIPVTWVEGTVKEALAHATGSHRDIRLPLTYPQRSNHAWMLVCLTVYSKAEEAKLTGFPTSTIGTMRRVRKQLIKAEQVLPTRWSAALSMASGKTWNMDLDWEDVVDQKAKEYADRIERAVGPQFFKNTDIMARTIEKLCPGRVEELVRLLTGDDSWYSTEDGNPDF